MLIQGTIDREFPPSFDLEDSSNNKWESHRRFYRIVLEFWESDVWRSKDLICRWHKKNMSMIPVESDVSVTLSQCEVVSQGDYVFEGACTWFTGGSVDQRFWAFITLLTLP